ncbi:MAG: hypothetical protein WBA43_01735 [Elainellaceae cyanobacterium]
MNLKHDANERSPLTYLTGGNTVNHAPFHRRRSRLGEAINYAAALLLM